MDMRFAFGGGFGVLAWLWLLVVVAFWGLVIVALVLGIRWLLRADQHRPPAPPPGSLTPAPPRPDDPLEILRQRYARGEIDDDEYNRRRTTLGGG
jgi:putative membrane protein